jgi:hypothetical protein
MTERCSTPPWSVEELDACFVVRDVNGEVLAYVYCEEAAAKLLSKDEARRPRESCDNQRLLIHINACTLEKSHSNNV